MESRIKRSRLRLQVTQSPTRGTGLTHRQEALRRDEASLVRCRTLGFSRARLSCPWRSHSRRYWNVSEFSGVNQNTPPYLLRPISLRFVPRARAGPWFIRHKSFLMSHRLLGWGGGPDAFCLPLYRQNISWLLPTLSHWAFCLLFPNLLEEESGWDIQEAIHHSVRL